MPHEMQRPHEGQVLIDVVAEWLMDQALGESRIETIFEGCCERLVAADVPLWRAYLGFPTLHPLFKAITLYWHRDGATETVEHGHDEASEAFQQSPHFKMLQTQMPFLRRRLEGPHVTIDFPVLEELRAQGATDYLAYLVPFDDDASDSIIEDGILGSWVSNRPNGFSDNEIRSLQRIQRRLAVACKVTIKQQIARNVLSAYLGRGAGEQVLRGKIKRGDGERIHAVIWFSDLRHSTAIAESMSLESYLAVLNEFFEKIAGAVIDHGGEVLRFIGDAVLAIFPMDVHDVVEPRACPVHREACERALAAARDAIARVETYNTAQHARGETALEFGIGLHVGDVMYGNIGAPGRVEFSVVGPAANHAARLEGLCKVLERSLLISQDFSEILPEDWVALGSHTFKGIGEPQSVFTVADDAVEVAAKATA